MKMLLGSIVIAAVLSTAAPLFAQVEAEVSAATQAWGDAYNSHEVERVLVDISSGLLTVATEVTP